VIADLLTGTLAEEIAAAPIRVFVLDPSNTSILAEKAIISRVCSSALRPSSSSYHRSSGQ